MRVLEAKSRVRERVEAERRLGRTVGLVPTMGYLHQGHLSLVDRAREENDFVVVSVFVNPAQFGPGEDLERYPRDLERDLALADSRGVDLVFAPGSDEMYASDHATWVDVEGLTEGLCGASRPGHFRAVATVVGKLFGICRPHRAYFGRKDAQQAFVVRRMARDLDMGVDIVVCPIVREGDGLAMSSRNVYLTPEERAQAPVISEALSLAEERMREGVRDGASVAAAVRERIESAPAAEVEYVEVVDTGSLRPAGRIEGETLVAVAVRFGGTRLIDNVLLHPRED